MHPNTEDKTPVLLIVQQPIRPQVCQFADLHQLPVHHIVSGQSFAIKKIFLLSYLKQNHFSYTLSIFRAKCIMNADYNIYELVSYPLLSCCKQLEIFLFNLFTIGVLLLINPCCYERRQYRISNRVDASALITQIGLPVLWLPVNSGKRTVVQSGKLSGFVAASAAACHPQ